MQPTVEEDSVKTSTMYRFMWLHIGSATAAVAVVMYII